MFSVYNVSIHAYIQWCHTFASPCNITALLATGKAIASSGLLYYLSEGITAGESYAMLCARCACQLPSIHGDMQ